MIKEKLQMFKRLHLTADLTLTVLAYISAFLIEFTFSAEPHNIVVLFHNHLNLLLAIIPIWGLILLKSPHAYSYRMKNFRFIALNVAKPVFISMGIFIALLMYLGPLIELRGILLLFAGFNIALLYLFRRVILSALHHFRARGYDQKNIIIVGTGHKACEFFDLAKANSEWGINVLGFISENGDRPLNGKSNLVIGDISILPRILNRSPVDEVYIALPTRSLHKVEQLVADCQEQGITAHLTTDFLNTSETFIANNVLGAPVLTFSKVQRRMDMVIIKRIFDIVVSGIALLLLSPVFAIIASAIKLDSRGPVFYRWKVVGHNRKNFIGYKFRSMVEQADKLKVKLMDKNEMKGIVFKMKNDPRITRVGRFLRKYSLDELPQLINVFRGEMSLVGPRPPLQTEIDGFENWQRRKLSVKPGITCLWQVSGRNNITDFNEWVRLDLEYIDKWSLWLDMKILARTIPAVLTGKGAS
ncbi:MAG: exopolysaccharide biosynthesis polyprenyl glycosylphosphotransferase [candidate division Zixibacteria bacterium]|nr:exopolysaccharide biosynthesis polyprenyl glycosylphosphotransferase [candidate division Zixibacteria bacterium]